MLRALQQLLDGPLLADHASVEHEHPIGDARNHAEVVGDEEQGQTQIGAQLGEELEHRRLHGHVERGGELVADDGDFTEAGGAQLTGELLRRHKGLTAITTGGLSQAVGALHTAWELGLAVPRDLSVVSFDDLSLAEYLRPPLTTVRMPLDRLGAAGVDALVDQLLGGEPCDVVVETRAEMVVRASTASPAA